MYWTLVPVIFRTARKQSVRQAENVSPDRPERKPTRGSFQSSQVGMASTRVGWPEWLACIVAIAGVLASILSGFHPREWQASGSDLKTLYASAACFRQHLDPYSFTNLAAVFRSNNVVPPTSWYAHAPVYPPLTLAVIAPLTYIPMVPAVYVWMALSAVSLVFAAFTLAKVSGETFGLSRPWRLLLIALFAASPLMSFGLEMCNVSPVVAALCIVAVAEPARPGEVSFLKAAALCVGLILKPHLAVWVIIPLLLSRARPNRALAIRAISFCAASVLAVAIWMAVHHQLHAQVASYRAIVGSELGAGSMGSSNHELIAVAAQITSLASLLGYWLQGEALHILTNVLLVLIAACLIVASRLRSAETESTRLLRIGAWSMFGLVATYHRAHDGTVLLLLLPVVVARLRRRLRDPFAWSYIILSLAAGLGPTPETFARLASLPGLSAVAHFLLYRQAALASVLLLTTLIVATIRSKTPRSETAREPGQEDIPPGLRAVA